MKKSVEYWAKMTRDPHQEIQEQWAKCQKHWGKINKVMKDVGLLEFDTPNEFTNLSEVFKTHSIQDSLWAKECAKIVDAKPGQVQQFAEYTIRDRTMLQLLNASLIKYRMHAVDIRGVYATPMEQHRFPWAQTYEDLFINWSEYEESHPFQEISQMNC
jgi:head-tail adaptor